jgi:hypothetical protein
MTPRRNRCNLGCRSAKNFSLNRAAYQYVSTGDARGQLAHMGLAW